MIVTVFTPTYNRAGYLRGLFDGLCRQTCKDFEWIVVDDGSSDGTKDVVNTLISSNPPFEMSYYYKGNGGKHTAINAGVRKAKGELFLIVDSDDCLASDAVEKVIGYYEEVSDDNKIGGVCGLMAHRDGSLIGTGFPVDDLVASSIELRYKYGVTGDLLEVFKTSVLREFPFPEVAEERFCPEVLVWNRIARKYRLKCFNQVVYYRDYLDGGLTDNIVKVRMNSPVFSMMCYAELCASPIPFVSKLKAAVNFWRFRLCANRECKQVRLSMLWLFVVPLALLMHLRDKIKVV